MASTRLMALAAILLTVLPCPLQAEGTSGTQFLGIAMGARAAAMGGAYVSVADDGAALYWNPAGLTRAGGHRATLSHASWLSDASYQYVSYATPLGRSGAVGVALEQGSISWDNPAVGSYEAGDFAGTVAYAHRLRAHVGVGGSVKFVSSSLGEFDAGSYAFDLGVVYRPFERATFGAAMRNLGPGMTFQEEADPLPTTFAVGGSYSWNDVLLSLDLEKVNDLEAATRIGVEYAPVEHLALRGGYVLEGDSALSPMTGGLGLRWDDRWSLDYAYRGSDLGATHQFGLTAGFGTGGGLIAASSIDTGDEGAPEEVVVPKPNLTVIGDLVRQVASEAVGKMGIAGDAEIYLKQVDSHDANWLVKSILLEEVTSRGHLVRSGQMAALDEEGGPPTYEIAYRIVSCRTSFPRSWREWLIGARKVERRTAVDIHFELSDASRAIFWAGSVQREKREIIPGSRLSDLAAPGQEFASPQAEPGGWDKVVEPVIVAGIVGGLIYLFYTSRTTE